MAPSPLPRGAYTCKAALVVACVAADVVLSAAGDFEAAGGGATFSAVAVGVQLALQLACLLLLLLLLLSLLPRLLSPLSLLLTEEVTSVGGDT